MSQVDGNKTYTTTLRHGRDLEMMLSALRVAEADRYGELPSKSEILRRLIWRAADKLPAATKRKWRGQK